MILPSFATLNVTKPSFECACPPSIYLYRWPSLPIAKATLFSSPNLPWQLWGSLSVHQITSLAMAWDGEFTHSFELTFINVVGKVTLHENSYGRYLKCQFVHMVASNKGSYQSHLGTPTTIYTRRCFVCFSITMKQFYENSFMSTLSSW
jgi:hypothetical protein